MRRVFSRAHTPTRYFIFFLSSFLPCWSIAQVQQQQQHTNNIAAEHLSYISYVPIRRGFKAREITCGVCDYIIHPLVESATIGGGGGHPPHVMSIIRREYMLRAPLAYRYFPLLFFLFCILYIYFLLVLLFMTGFCLICYDIWYRLENQ